MSRNSYDKEFLDMMDLMFTKGQKVQIYGNDVTRTVMQTAKKIFTFKRDMGQPFVEEIQRIQREPFDGASI